MTPQEIRARRSWLLSFGDMTTLLICFFIMTLVLNKSDVHRIHQWVDQQIEQSYQQLRQLVQDQHLDGISLVRDNEGILIRIQTNQAFASAQTHPEAELQQVLHLIAQTLPQLTLTQIPQRYPQLMAQLTQAGIRWYTDIMVEGHTDNDAINETSPLRNNWQLSALRAQAVMTQLQQESQLPAELFSVAGHGEYQPLVANDSDAHKAQNRRIDIRITASLIKRHD